MGKKGVRPRVILDDYMLKLMRALIKKNYPLSELAKVLDVDISNLQKKVASLEKENILVLDRSGTGRTVIVSLNRMYWDVANMMSPDLTTKRVLDLYATYGRHEREMKAKGYTTAHEYLTRKRKKL